MPPAPLSNKRIRLYIDIDGVLLRKDSDEESVLIPNIQKLLKYMIGYYDCFWLSTHSWRGLEGVLSYLGPFFDEKGRGLLKQVKAVPWKTLKTEAIDFDVDFIWLENDPLVFELEILKQRGCLKNWFRVDSYSNPNYLTIKRLEAKRIELFGK